MDSLEFAWQCGFFVVLFLTQTQKAIVEPRQETSPHVPSHGGLSVEKHIGSSAQQLDAKSQEVTRVLAFTSQGFG